MFCRVYSCKLITFIFKIFKPWQGASIHCFVGRSVRLSQKFKCPIFQHIIANKYLFHLGDDGRRRRSRGGGGEGGGGEGGGVDGGGGSKYIIVKVQTIPELIAYPCLFFISSYIIENMRNRLIQVGCKKLTPLLIWGVMAEIESSH